MVFFEAPHRLHPSLVAMAAAFGPGRAAVVCRELTKTYEEVRRGPLAELAGWAADGVRGEVTVVVAGAEPAEATLADGVAEVTALRAGGVTLRTAVGEVAERRGLPKNALYDAALAAR